MPLSSDKSRLSGFHRDDAQSLYHRCHLVWLLDRFGARRRRYNRKLENLQSLGAVYSKGASVGGDYLTITNTGNVSDRLTGGSSDVSSRFEIHEMSMENGVMKMRPLESGLEIKSGQTLEFKPGAITSCSSG